MARRFSWRRPKRAAGLTQGGVEAPLHTLESVGNLHGAHDDELLVAGSLHGGGDHTLGVALGLKGGVGVDLVGAQQGGQGLLGAVVDGAGQDQVLHRGVGEQQAERGEVVLGSHGGVAHVGDGVGDTQADGHLLGVVLAGVRGGQATHEGAGASAHGGLSAGQAVHINVSGDGGSGDGVLHGQIRLLRIIALELQLEAGQDVVGRQGGLHSHSAVVGELQLIYGEARRVGPLQGHLGLEGALAILVNQLYVSGEGL